MKALPSPVGVLGGTFDPIHHGHLRAALEALEALDLAEVRFIPCRLPPHRGQPIATAAQRLAMLKLALVDQPGFSVDERELHRDGLSYMVDTLSSLRNELGGVALYLILGMDAFDGLPQWHRWRAIPELAHLLVLHRPGAEPPRSPALVELIEQRGCTDPRALQTHPAGGILFQPMTQLDISATRIRALLAQGNSPRYLLPDFVCSYIRERDLYRSPLSSSSQR